MAKPKPVSFAFPLKGWDQSGAHAAQPKGTSADLLNVMPYDAGEGRLRGGQRPGLVKFQATALAGPVMQMVQAAIGGSGGGGAAVPGGLRLPRW